MSVVVDGESLRLDRLAEVALDCRPVTLASDARERVAACRADIDSALARDAVIYGVTTGFGKQIGRAHV